MPAHTSSPPIYRGEADFWSALLKLDDGNLHCWHGVTLNWGTSIDVVLLDPSVGLFCLEVSNLSLNDIAHIELKFLTRRDGGVSLSPFGQATGAAKEFGAALDTHWEDRPDIIPIVAFPNIGREEWLDRFQGTLIGDLACRCILKDDLSTTDHLREMLREVASKSTDMRRRTAKSPPAILDPEKLDAVLTAQNRISKSAKSPEDDSEESIARGLIDETIALIEGPGMAYHSPGAESLSLWRASLDTHTSRLRVSVVGEFKSGKSSLINAILGREVCYVDEFEATTMSALYTDGETESVSVLDVQNNIVEWSIESFLERCAQRDLGSIRRVVVSLPSGLPFDLVDSPGLGSYTDGHTEEAEREIRRSDLLLWTVDCNDAGSAREGAFIQRAREIGLPILVLLTKSEQLDPEETEALVEYLSNETNLSRADILPVSAHEHINGQSRGINKLINRLTDASEEGTVFQKRAYAAKVKEALDASISTLRFVVEMNTANARFVAAERGYLETSALGIGVAARVEWLRVLREECAKVAGDIVNQSSLNKEDIERILQAALPEAVNNATNKFVKSLRRLVRDEWRGALEERSREFEFQLVELLNSRPDAKTDIDFLRNQSEAFRLRAEVVASETEPIGFDNRLLIVGLGAAASFVTVSMLPIAVAGVVAAIAMRSDPQSVAAPSGMDVLIADQIEDALLSSFETVSQDFERAIQRIVSEVASRSLVKLVNRRRGADLKTILVIERKGWDLLDELSAARQC